MSGFLSSLANLLSHIVFFVMVEPWEQCLVVRAGKYVRAIGPGLHLRIPILDAVYKQTVRRRFCLIATQTLTTADNVVVTVGASLGYAIADIEKLYRTLHHAEDSIIQVAAAALAAFISESDRQALTPKKIGSAVSTTLNAMLETYGLHDVSLCVTDFAVTRTIRLVQDGRWSSSDGLKLEKGK